MPVIGTGIRSEGVQDQAKEARTLTTPKGFGLALQPPHVFVPADLLKAYLKALFQRNAPDLRVIPRPISDSTVRARETLSELALQRYTAAVQDRLWCQCFVETGLSLPLCVWTQDAEASYYVIRRVQPGPTGVLQHKHRRCSAWGRHAGKVSCLSCPA